MKLTYYKTLEAKAPNFNQSAVIHYRIDHAYQLNDWYNQTNEIIKYQEPFANFFRGMDNAKYKLYNSAQRFWICNNLEEIEALSVPVQYIEMVQNMVNKAKQVKLLQQVFQYYNLADDQQDFPLLSILQHYNAPTPLLDWSYNLDVALYFALSSMKKNETENDIEDYISIYRINKNDHSYFMKNNLNYISANIFPSVTGLSNYLTPDDSVVYISDFEIQDQSDDRKIKPLTTYYNLNIIAQRGLFVFNPSKDVPLENYPSLPPRNGSQCKIYCYNIHKDLAEFIRLLIGKNKIDTDFLFPELRNYSKNILNDYLKELVGSVGK
jgi:hypothetical protein